jgi:hypothetical protein
MATHIEKNLRALNSTTYLKNKPKETRAYSTVCGMTELAE